MEDTNGSNANSTQEAPTLIRRLMTDTKPMAADAVTNKVEEAEASKAEEAEASKEEDIREEVAHLETSITNRITKMTNMVHHPPFTLISRVMPHPVTHQTSQMDLDMAIIITEMRPGLLSVFISALCPIGPLQSCLHLALTAKESHTAEL